MHQLRFTSLAIALIFVVAPGARAGAQGPVTFQYEYDELGRLIRIVDQTTGEVATYHYDAVSNMLSITRETVDELQPQGLGISPAAGRAANSVAVTITGENLLGGTVTTDNAGIQVSDSRSTDTSISATFVIDETARQGQTAVMVDNGLGVGTVMFRVLPPLPRLTLSPRVLALVPNTEAPLTLNLSNADVVDVTVDLTVADPTVATVSPSSVTIPAGQTSADVVVRGGVLGTTILSAQAETQTVAASIFVTQPFRGAVTAKAAAVSVEVKQAPPPQEVSALPVTVAVKEAAPPVQVMAPLVSVEVDQPQAPRGVFAPPVSVEIQGEPPSAKVVAPPVSVETP